MVEAKPDSLLYKAKCIPTIKFLQMAWSNIVHEHLTISDALKCHTDNKTCN